MVQASNGNKIVYRLADFEDETDILAVLEEVAPEIPVELDGPERQEKIKTTIIECCRKVRQSWIAVDANDQVVGFILARPDVYKCQAAIFISYVGVRAELRRRRIFSTLIEKLKANGVPLVANVLHRNRSSMVDNLQKVGFKKIESDFDTVQTKMVWSPAIEQEKCI